MSFDAQSFLDSAISTSNSTKITPVPIGEYPAIIEKVIPRQWQSKDGTQTGVALDIFWMIEDEGVKAALGRTNVTAKQGVMLDLLPSGALDTAEGKNVQLGRLREAVGKNREGEVFSFSMLPGMAAKVSISHRVAGEEIYSEVKAVAAL